MDIEMEKKVKYIRKLVEHLFKNQPGKVEEKYEED
jgi:hypothetical protein